MSYGANSPRFSAVFSQVASVRFSLVIIITGMLLLEHVIACGWFGLGSMESASGKTWLTEYELQDVLRRSGLIIWKSVMGQSWSVQKLGEREREREILDAPKWKGGLLYLFLICFFCFGIFSWVSASLLFCSLLLCLFASLQDFCFSASLLFPAKSLLLCFPCFFPSLLFCFFAVLLLCSAFPAFLLLKPKQSLLRYII